MTYSLGDSECNSISWNPEGQLCHLHFTNFHKLTGKKLWNATAVHFNIYSVRIDRFTLQYMIISIQSVYICIWFVSLITFQNRVSRFDNNCPCNVWCRRLTIYLLHNTDHKQNSVVLNKITVILDSLRWQDRSSEWTRSYDIKSWIYYRPGYSFPISTILYAIKAYSNIACQGTIFTFR